MGITIALMLVTFVLGVICTLLICFRGISGFVEFILLLAALSQFGIVGFEVPSKSYAQPAVQDDC